MDTSNGSMDSTHQSSRVSAASSSLLQDKIKEKRSQTQKASRIRDLNGLAQEISVREVQSSPLAPAGSKNGPDSRARKPSSTASNKHTSQKPMGLREMQDHITRVDKQNFDLKLQLFHQRQRCESLETKVDKVESLETENENLRADNSDLVLRTEQQESEIEKLETAVEEAVGMICEREAEIEDLKERLKQNEASSLDGAPPPPPHTYEQPPSTSFDKEPLSLEVADSVAEPSDDVLRRQASLAGTSRSPLRPPSFLWDEKKSHTALRSLYASRNGSVTSFNRASSVLSDEELDEELEQQMLSGSRLSILSESGFSSVYGHVREKSKSPVTASSGPISKSTLSPNSSQGDRTAQRQARTKEWVHESQHLDPPETPRRQPSHKSSDNRFTSIGEVLEKVPSKQSQATEASASPQSRRSGATSEKQGSDKSNAEQRSPVKSLRKSARAHEKLSPRGSVFNNLPPTPDTMSTTTIGGGSSTQSIVTEKSMVDIATRTLADLSSANRNERSASSEHGFALIYTGKPPVAHYADFDPSEEDVKSTKVEQDDDDTQYDQIALPNNSPYLNGSFKAARFFGADYPVRPKLSTHVTDVVFNGDGYSPKRDSRTSSYPSPRSALQRSPTGPSSFSPASNRSSAVMTDKTVTPPRLPPPSTARPITVSPTHSKKGSDAPAEPDPMIRNGHSLRFRLPARHSTTLGSHFAKPKIFRRNRNQPIGNQEPAPEESDSRPSSRPRLGRPTSIHGQLPTLNAQNPLGASSGL